MGVRYLNEDEEVESLQQGTISSINPPSQQHQPQSSLLCQPPDLVCPITPGANQTVRSPQAVSWFRSFQGGLLGSFSEEDQVSAGREDNFQSTSFDIVSGDVSSAFSTPTRSVYYIGLIDVLQRYTFAKRVENFYKTRIRCSDRDGLSAIDVDRYARRFLSAMNKHFV